MYALEMLKHAWNYSLKKEKKIECDRDVREMIHQLRAHTVLY